METTAVTIAEGKRDFSHLIKDVAEGKADIVVTKRGKPMAVIIPYLDYQRSQKAEAHLKILESRTVFVKAGVSADKVYKESREKLEGRG
ncbi:MAG: type II toxin-antitoxin system Phd/YefM family antitoxin [Deltaproteobacteria bacterium]|nr:type II toxin-antitoxin system Phd/YefM family antitoxin [Deltaproteobacteria bacterium]